MSEQAALGTTPGEATGTYTQEQSHPTDSASASAMEGTPPAPPTGDSPEVAALKAELGGMQTQVSALRQLYMQQQQQMQYAAAPASPQEPPPVELPPELQRMDEDDPYASQFKAVLEASQRGNTSMQGQIGQLQQAINQISMNSARQSVQQQVDSAISRFKVPESMAQDVRTTAYAYMASTPQGQQVSADHLVQNFMQNLGRYADQARKQWSDEAKKPKPLSVLSSSPGVPQEQPKNFNEAKERSLAMMRSMLEQAG